MFEALWVIGVAAFTGRHLIKAVNRNRKTRAAVRAATPVRQPRHLRTSGEFRYRAA